MKNMKKLASLLLALTLLVALAVPAIAAGETGSITVKQAVPGQTYTLYKLFDLSYGGNGVENEADAAEPSGSNDPHTYSISTLSPWYAFVSDDGAGASYVKLAQKTGDDNTYYVTWNDGADAAAFAKAAVTFAKGNDKITGTAQTAPAAAEGETTSTVAFTGLELGYYLIDSTLGTLCALDTTNYNANVTEKNELPTLTKKIVDGDNKVDALTASYGDTVTFQIDVKIPANAEGEMIVHDQMDENLTYGDLTADSFAAAVADGNETGEGVTACTKHFTISAEQVSQRLGQTVSIIYTATLNTGAPTQTDLKNIAHLSYVDYETPKDEVKVSTYEFDLVKTNSDSEVLSDAVFTLWTAKDGGEQIKVVANGAVYTVDPSAVESAQIIAGHVTIQGLANGTYWLQEEEAPEGYNKLNTRVSIAITDANNKAKVEDGVYAADVEDDPETTDVDETFTNGGLKVINLTGAEMPSTGGIGTTIFYIVGGLLIAGAGILLITRKRMNGEEK